MRLRQATRLQLLSLAVVLALVLAACGDGRDDGDDTAGGDDTEETSGGAAGGTEGGGMSTTIGDRCAFLANSHVGHDCHVGSNVIFSNNVMLAGHCSVGDFAIIGGGAAVIQFARVGAHAFLGGMSGLENDLIPYGMALGNRAHLSGLNIVGLQRRGFSRADIHDLRRAYRLLFAAEGTLSERTADVAQEFAGQPIVQEILEFIRAGGKRSLCTPKEAAEA